jgi:hypothetical protein
MCTEKIAAWMAAELADGEEAEAIITEIAEDKRKFTRASLVVVLLLSFGFPLAALGAPPDGADPDSPIGQWFKSLRQPDTGLICCSIADCRPIEYRIAVDHYEVAIDGRWVSVPPEKVVHRENPTGHAILCRGPASSVIFCFVPAHET